MIVMKMGFISFLFTYLLFLVSLHYGNYSVILFALIFLITKIYCYG
ncbi:Uncharacterised protein [Porphyromonas macacae]|uniref:Uncharacterized protein n=1 Tax=Porphyromonas macacae TaxID=28115 RepID=A0A379EC05_9PORP|nr:Uncharacterised protein [Porphyromonas macacae]